MKDEEILQGIKKYFCIQEFVSEKVYKKHGENAWQFLSIRLLHTMLIIREDLDKSITINNWKWGGKFRQRGLRSNMGYIVLKMVKRMRIYLSGHVLGCAVDFDVKGMTAVEVRQYLNGIHKKLPYKIRLENTMNGKPISWVHLDCISNIKNNKVYLFNV